MIQLKELPPPPPYSETPPSCSDTAYDEEAAFEATEFPGLESDPRNTIHPGGSQRWWSRNFKRQLLCLFGVIVAVALTPYVVLVILMSQWRF
ncbi:hypothetical protein BDV32DRAFT_34904 [Aspergillus pseudonomiae]|uniref:Uncharacterized protein n=1 Tax=Aspergillus pseudonomiae TaxID=1506151 RepID=A0A5N6IIN3_9EURO|nr:uncharacterized protein BDV37DRAFT_281580 [Aspergillus pseudonomiae]KAB8265699.1 hypothetical protein BDV32DRAFT_34904 [Aspergillus pseudonomiae]KAE8405747.1 hypothetical protein BDV37DRAFT_281580 [Aspergillus pseudonomiae]